MKLNLVVGFAVSTVATVMILLSLGFEDRKLAQYRLDELLQQEIGLKERIAAKCSSLVSPQGLPVEKYFLDRYAPTSGKDGGRACTLMIHSSNTHRFHLRSHWNFAIQIRGEDGKVFLESFHPVDFPRPLTLLPLVILVLALVFEFRPWGLAWTLLTYIFLLGGGNLIAAADLAWRSLRMSVRADQTLPGLLLVALWLALFRSNRQHNPAVRTAEEKEMGSAPKEPPSPPGKRVAPEPTIRRWQTWLNRTMVTVIGLWNPALFTLASRLIFPFKGTLVRAAVFLDSQVFVACLSLYLLAFDFRSPMGFVFNGLMLPRYFTFTIILFVLVSYWSVRSHRQRVVWQLPHFWRTFAFVAAAELLSFYVPFLDGLPTLTRVGGALALSELVWPVRVDWRACGRTFGAWGGTVLLGSFIAMLSAESGARDLALVLFEPRIHPSAIVLFTFLAGIVLGFVTGSFPAAYFALFTMMLKSQAQPLVQAALLDGILAGMLLSPFSLFNLLPAVQYRLKAQDLLKFRARQLAIPLFIGGAIYAVSGVNSVAILRPVTFVFLCLVALAFQLKKSSWTVGRRFFMPPTQPISP